MNSAFKDSKEWDVLDPDGQGIPESAQSRDRGTMNIPLSMITLPQWIELSKWIGKLSDIKYWVDIWRIEKTMSDFKSKYMIMIWM